MKNEAYTIPNSHTVKESTVSSTYPAHETTEPATSTYIEQKNAAPSSITAQIIGMSIEAIRSEAAPLADDELLFFKEK